MLCFPTDHSWFQGNINTEDDSSYSLFGDRLTSQENLDIIQSSTDCNFLHDDNNNTDEKGDETLVVNVKNEGITYKVTLTDHFTGLNYNLPEIRVHLDPKAAKFLTCSQDAQVWIYTLT